MKWIIISVIVALTVLVFYGIYSVRRKIRTVSKSFFGTDSFIEGYKNQKEILSDEPKSVSGMTRIYLPMIMKDFPEFNYDEFKTKAENMLMSAFDAITNENKDLVMNGSKDIIHSVSLIICNNINSGYKETYKNVKIHQTEICGYKKMNGTCVITLQSAVEYFHYIEKEDKLMTGDKQLKEQTRYNTDIVYIQDVSKLEGESQTAFVGAVCPNCGAPVSSLGNKYCEYCGSEIKTVNVNVWAINKYIKL